MGSNTLNGMFYKPDIGASGAVEKGKFDDGLDGADLVIEANKPANNKLSAFAATTSAELAGVISDEEGSGKLVFNNSPVLVTPALGTPASGNLANCSGVTVAGGGTGETTKQAAINSLTDVAGAGDESVLTKDTTTGNAVFKAAATPAGSPAGAVIGFAGASAPSGWVFCDGSAISRTTYAGLFAVIAEIYGVGDGSTTFNVPNLKGRVPVGLDSGQIEFNALADSGGANKHTLLIAEMPAHTHGVSGSNSGGNLESAGMCVGRVVQCYSSSTGGGGAHNNLQPYLAINYIIKT